MTGVSKKARGRVRTMHPLFAASWSVQKAINLRLEALVHNRIHGIHTHIIHRQESTERTVLVQRTIKLQYDKEDLELMDLKTEQSIKE